MTPKANKTQKKSKCPKREESSFINVRKTIVRTSHDGRTKIPPVKLDYSGPIPNIDVGTTWLYRSQVSECGVHRPIVGGIHGRANVQAFSIVLSGIYPGNEDGGKEIIYCGSGGRANDPTKRIAPQIKHQELTGNNKALANSCNADLCEDGAESADWRNGKPIRVVRNYKGKKEFSPKEGNRYDGIYKVFKYDTQQDKNNFKYYRFHLRRDDDSIPPWTEEGQQLLIKKGLDQVIIPDRPYDSSLNSKKKKTETEKITPSTPKQTASTKPNQSENRVDPQLTLDSFYKKVKHHHHALKVEKQSNEMECTFDATSVKSEFIPESVQNEVEVDVTNIKVESTSESDFESENVKTEYPSDLSDPEEVNIKIENTYDLYDLRGVEINNEMEYMETDEGEEYSYYNNDHNSNSSTNSACCTTGSDELNTTDDRILTTYETTNSVTHNYLNGGNNDVRERENGVVVEEYGNYNYDANYGGSGARLFRYL